MNPPQSVPPPPSGSAPDEVKKSTSTMKHGIQTTSKPDKPECLYMRNLYHEFFWGPFSDEAELTGAVLALDKADPQWDYEPFCIIYGANPLPLDFVFGFRFAEEAIKERVSNARKAAAQ